MSALKKFFSTVFLSAAVTNVKLELDLSCTEIEICQCISKTNFERTDERIHITQATQNNYFLQRKNTGRGKKTLEFIGTKTMARSSI